MFLQQKGSQGAAPDGWFLSPALELCPSEEGQEAFFVDFLCPSRLSASALGHEHPVAAGPGGTGLSRTNSCPHALLGTASSPKSNTAALRFSERKQTGQQFLECSVPE